MILENLAQLKPNARVAPSLKMILVGIRFLSGGLSATPNTFLNPMAIKASEAWSYLLLSGQEARYLKGSLDVDFGLASLLPKFDTQPDSLTVPLLARGRPESAPITFEYSSQTLSA